MLYLRVWETAELEPGFEGLKNSKTSLSLFGELDLEGIDVTTEAVSLQLRSHFVDVDIVILKNSKAVIQMGCLIRWVKSF